MEHFLMIVSRTVKLNNNNSRACSQIATCSLLFKKCLLKQIIDAVYETDSQYKSSWVFFLCVAEKNLSNFDVCYWYALYFISSVKEQTMIYRCSVMKDHLILTFVIHDSKGLR